jgi:chemotaxis protein CheY-P-specific phosphatase CheC
MIENAGPLSADHLSALQAVFREGSLEASRALGRWLGKTSLVSIDTFVQLPLAEATQILGDGETPILFGGVQIRGSLSGDMILAFDQQGGQSLVEMLLGPNEASKPWNELSVSAVLETTNIVSCAYLNRLSRRLESNNYAVSLLPSTAEFKQEYPQSLLEFALMGQAMRYDHALIAETLFEIQGTRLNWTLLFLPDAESMEKLSQLLDARNEIA